MSAAGTILPRLYAAAWTVGLCAGSPYVLVRALRDPREMRERAGRWSPLPARVEGDLWIHAASVGEGRAAARLLGALARRGHAPLLTVMTPAARRLAPQWRAAGAGAVRHIPFDWPPALAAAFAAQRPAALLCVETEIWPALLRATSSRRLPAAFISARLGERSLRRLWRWRAALAPGLARWHVAAQSATDAERWAALGVPRERIAITGNIKYARPAGALAAGVRHAARGGWRQIVTFGSVRRGELAAVREAIARLHATDREMLCIVAPRHPQQLGPALRHGWPSGYRIVVRSKRSDPLLPPAAAVPTVLLLETIGELADVYAVSDAAFVGGTLVPIGGHNLLEPAERGVPVCYGPSTENVREVAAALEEHGGGECVADGAALGAYLCRLAVNAPERARRGAAALAATAALEGALEATLAQLAAWDFPLRAEEG